MTQTDWIGFFGVTVLLIAYFLNLFSLLKKESLVYIFLNCAGAGMACFAAILLRYLPFIILEGSWTLVSVIGLCAWFFRKAVAAMPKKN